MGKTKEEILNERLGNIYREWQAMNEELKEFGVGFEPFLTVVRNSENEDRIDHCYPRCFNPRYIQHLMDGGDPKSFVDDGEDAG